MSSTSKKHRDFLGEPMGSKDVEKIPGIGSVIGEKMKKKGIRYAYQIFGQFLVLRKDEDEFCECLEQFTANKKQRSDCYNAMLDWSQKYFE